MTSIESTPAKFAVIDRSRWPRSEHLDFFGAFREPFFSVTAEVRCTGLVERCKHEARSTTYDLWHGALRGANEIEEFRYRLHDGEPVLYEEIHLSPTILRDDKTFMIGFVPYLEDREAFASAAHTAVEEVKATTGFSLDTKSRRVDLVHFSTIPWFRFTGLSHARPFNATDCETKVTIGRYGKVGRDYLLPVSVTGHHGLMDGYHVALYLEALESYWNGS